MVKFQVIMPKNKTISFSAFAILNIVFLITVIFSFSTSPVEAREREKPLNDSIYQDNIKTVEFFREGWNFSLPILEMGSNERLVLKFDELNNQTRNYSYTITHCDFDWFPSRLIPSEYMEGFIENPVNDYRTSINTTIPYVNYQLAIPNENVRLLVSGNYLLKVFEDGKQDSPILTRRFYVVEPSARINGIVKNATFDRFRGPNQEVDFTFDYPRLNIQNPSTEVKVVLMQNFRYDNAITNLRPLYIRNNQLSYDYNQENVFKAGNEFRNFDAKILQVNGLGVRNIEFIPPLYNVFLETDYPRSDQSYIFENDLNGQYLIKNDRSNDPDLESDYILVHFSLQVNRPLPEGDIYVFGGLSNWKCSEANKLNYNTCLKTL